MTSPALAAYRVTRVVLLGLLCGCLAAPVVSAQECKPDAAPRASCTSVDADGTARIERVLPLPRTISPQAQKLLMPRPGSAMDVPLAERRRRTDAFRSRRSEEARQLFPVKVEEKMMGGVRTDVITPLSIPAAKRNHVLINVHGGGFVSDSGSLVEGIPIANLTQTTVVSVYYRLAPENPFPAAVDDTVAVYKELLKRYKPRNMALFGTSAGAILTAEVAVRLRQLGLPLPAALGIFSGTGDMGIPGDTNALFTDSGLQGNLAAVTFGSADPYVDKTDPKDPVLSPIYADLKEFPPALFITSTRDLLLSGTTMLHRAFLKAGVDAQLVVFEALPHAFWYSYNLPETKECLALMAQFFDKNVGQ